MGPIAAQYRRNLRRDSSSGTRTRVSVVTTDRVSSSGITRKFHAAFHAKRIQLAPYCFEEWFGFGEFFDCHNTRVKRRRGLERARDGKAEADLVTADIQSFSGERKHVAVMFGGNS